MARYIDANKLKDRIKASCAFTNIGQEGYFLQDCAIDLIDRQPTADVVEVKHGEWKPIDPKSDVRFFCSECETEISTSWDYEEPEMWRYCPCCGAKMDGERKGE